MNDKSKDKSQDAGDQSQAAGQDTAGTPPAAGNPADSAADKPAENSQRAADVAPGKSPEKNPGQSAATAAAENADSGGSGRAGSGKGDGGKGDGGKGDSGKRVSGKGGSGHIGDSKSPATAGPDTPVAEQATGPGRALVYFVLLVAVAALGLGGWQWYQQQFWLAQQDVRTARQDALEERLQADIKRIDTTTQRASENIDKALQASRQTSRELNDLVSSERSRSAELMARQQADLAALQSSLQSQRQQLLELSSTDRVDWSLAEAEYLARLAYQRLLMAEDPKSALALLASADAILRDLDDSGLLAARRAIADDMAALRSVPELDVEGTWLRLQALANRIDTLILFDLPQGQNEMEALPADADWKQRLQYGWDAAWKKLSSYIVVRRNDGRYEELLDPQWEQLVRQNLRLQIGQSQAALLSANQTLYDASLTSTRRWLSEFFSFQQGDVKAMDNELEQLMAIKISRDFPDISGSLRAIKAATDDAARAARSPADRAPTDRGPTDRGPTDRGPTDRGPTGSGR